jgi:parvulin-like peptidyl-prolyl isomerase
MGHASRKGYRDEGFSMIRTLGLIGCVVGTTWLYGGSADPEVTVNGRVITTGEIDAAFARTSLGKQPLTQEQRSLYRAHVVNVLVDAILVKQFLEKEGVQGDPEAVERHIADFEGALKEKKTTLAAFLEENQASIEQMRQEVADMYQWFNYVDAQSTPANLKKYFEANKSALDGSQVRARHILAELPPNASLEMKKKGMARMEQIRAQLAAGTDFASLARQHSDCQSKTQGGDIGYFPRKGKVTEAFAAAAFKLSPGQVSEIVESEYGLHLIEVIDRKAGQDIPFETVAEDVRGLFATDLRADVIKKMRQQSAIQMAQPTGGPLVEERRETSAVSGAERPTIRK